MATKKDSYRLRVRTTGEDAGTRWIVSHRLYSLPALLRRLEQLRRAGMVAHWDRAEWHDRAGMI